MFGAVSQATEAKSRSIINDEIRDGERLREVAETPQFIIHPGYGNRFTVAPGYSGTHTAMKRKSSHWSGAQRSYSLVDSPYIRSSSYPTGYSIYAGLWVSSPILPPIVSPKQRVRAEPWGVQMLGTRQFSFYTAELCQST